jgi:hypothetical protein
MSLEPADDGIRRTWVHSKCMLMGRAVIVKEGHHNLFHAICIKHFVYVKSTQMFRLFKPMWLYVLRQSFKGHWTPHTRGFLILSRLLVGFLWTSGQPVANTSTYTGQHNTKTNIHASSGVWTHDPSNLRLRPRGHRDRRLYVLEFVNITTNIAQIYISKLQTP